MKQNSTIPLYAADGTSLGLRTTEAAQRLVAAGHVTASYGRRGHLKGIWLRREGERTPVAARTSSSKRYSYLKNLDAGGRCWHLRRLDQRDEDGTRIDTRSAFAQVVADCLVGN